MKKDSFIRNYLTKELDWFIYFNDKKRCINIVNSTLHHLNKDLSSKLDYNYATVVKWAEEEPSLVDENYWFSVYKDIFLNGNKKLWKALKIN